MREKLGLPEDQKFFSFMFSKHKQQVNIMSILTRTIAYVQVPPNLTYILQSLNFNVNAFTKSFLKSRFQEWYAKEVTNGLNKGENVHQFDIDTKLSKMKPIHSRLLISLYYKLQNSSKMIKSAFENASIMEADNKKITNEDPFKHLSE